MTDTDKLASVRVDLAEWRRLAYNAAQMRNAQSFGRCNRNVERLERIESALIRRIRNS